MGEHRNALFAVNTGVLETGFALLLFQECGKFALKTITCAFSICSMCMFSSSYLRGIVKTVDRVCCGRHVGFVLSQRSQELTRMLVEGTRSIMLGRETTTKPTVLELQ